MSWQKNLTQGFTSVSELLIFLELPVNLGCNKAERSFKTRVPREFASRMKKGCPNDPLLLQVLATHAEQLPYPEFTKDPLLEAQFNPLPGLIHKYAGRVLFSLTGSCAIHCRYCFRRHFPYEKNNPGTKGWQDAIQYIAQDPSIHEVILSGGDPLIANDALFSSLLPQLEVIPHLRTLRIHSRIPIVLPERITSAWLRIFANSRLKKVMVLHCNHPQEINEKVQTACEALKASNFHLLNQTVLLRGINDRVERLQTLSERLFEIGVLPYYLHLLDKVEGAGHFDLSHEDALALYRELQTRLPGYLVPKLAKEMPGKLNKILLS